MGSSERPIVTAFAIWFVDFLVIWAAVEIWPHELTANVVAWGATAIALLAQGAHGFRLKALYADGGLSGWGYRFARGAVAIAMAAVVFSAVPSFVFLP